MPTPDLSQLDELSAQGQWLTEGTQAFDTHQEFVRWVDRVADWLSAITPNTGLVSEWRSLKRSRLVHGGSYYDYPAIWDDFYAAVHARLEWLSRLPARLSQAGEQRPVKENNNEGRPRVFIVHGRDEAAKEAAARLVEKLNFEAIILHEQPNRGQTLIEKLEHHSNVSFAIVLLTPDDVGSARDEEDVLLPRARQNVILELGIFLGKLTRSHVCALYKGNVELPSDFTGVAYIEMDTHGAWRTAVARELQAAGFDVDLRRLL